MSGIDWLGLMRAGLGGLGLAPEVFWRLSPVELRMMLGLEATAQPLTRARLAELAAAFPDHRVGESHVGIRDAAGPTVGAGGATGRVGGCGGGL